MPILYSDNFETDPGASIDTNATATWSTTQAHSGTHSLDQKSTGSGDSFLFFGNCPAVTNELIKYSMWIRPARPSCYLYWDEKDQFGTYITGWYPAPITGLTTSVWQQVSIIGPVQGPGTDHLTLRMGFPATANNQHTFWDDPDVRTVTAPSSRIITPRVPIIRASSF